MADYRVNDVSLGIRSSLLIGLDKPRNVARYGVDLVSGTWSQSRLSGGQSEKD